MAPKRWIFLAVLAAPALAGWGQTPSGWRAYRVPDGLPEPACSSVTVGLNGKVLVSHPGADFISELDGYSVRTFPRPGAESGAVSESPGGQLWSIVPEGLMEWKGGNWILHPVPEIAAEFRKRPRLPRPVPFLPVQQGRVLFLVPDRLMEFNLEELNRPLTVALRSADQMAIGPFTGMAPARDGGLWITGTRGLARTAVPVRGLKPDDDWREFLPPASLAIQNLREPRESAEGGLMVVADSNGSAQRTGANFDGAHWTRVSFGSERIHYAWRGPGLASRGLTAEALLQSRDGQVMENEDISARQYFDMAIEPGGAVWLGTSEGLFRDAPLPWRIPAALAGLNTHVRCVVQDAADRLWFVSNGKLHSLQNDSHQEFALPESAKNVPTPSLYPLGAGTLLLSAGEELFRFLPGDHVFHPVAVPGEEPPGRVIGLFRDGKVCLQNLSRTGAVRWSLDKFDGVRRQRLPVPPPESYESEECSVFFEAQNGDLWLGGEHVVLQYHDKKWNAYVSSDKTTPEGARCFLEQPDGKIWCGTSDQIWEFDGRSWSLVHAGFDRLNSLIRTRDGSVWAASNGGLQRFWRGAWIENGLEDGLPGLAVHAVYEDPFGRIWAATARGLSRYFPEADTDPPRTQIRMLNGESQIVYEGGTLSLQFIGQDKWKFTAADQLLFSYRLDQNEWSSFQPRNAVFFSDLAAGKHSCQVRALDRNGNLETPARLEFAVALPWYKETRLLFSSCLGLAAAIFFAALAFNRHRQLLRSYAEVERKVAQRTRELDIANRELFHSQKMNALGTLAAGVAHDFNNILSIIKGSAQIIEENPDHPEKIRTRVDRIKTVVEQGSGIVKAMLGFSRDSDGKIGLCDANEVVDDTVRLLGDRFLREVEVRFQRATPLPLVPISKDFVQQVLLNFIFNAAESMTPPKLVVLSTQSLVQLPAGLVLLPGTAASYVALSVRDSGCGIPPENLPRIFEPFFTTKSLSARRGTGLGLSMAYELAKKMAAGLGVESTVDQGSVFTLILPVWELPAEEKS